MSVSKSSSNSSNKRSNKSRIKSSSKSISVTCWHSCTVALRSRRSKAACALSSSAVRGLYHGKTIAMWETIRVRWEASRACSHLRAQQRRVRLRLFKDQQQGSLKEFTTRFHISDGAFLYLGLALGVKLLRAQAVRRGRIQLQRLQ